MLQPHPPLPCPPGATRYCLWQNWLALEGLVSFENELGKQVFRVDTHNSLLFQDMQGNLLIQMQKKLAHRKDWVILYRGRQPIAIVQKALIAPPRDRVAIHLPGSEPMAARGDMVDYEYAIDREGERCAEISKRWFPHPASYGVEIASNQNDILILAITAAIDILTRLAQ